MSKNGEKKRKRRAALYDEQHGLCFWCEIPMELFYKVPPGYNSNNLCTVDHLRGKRDRRRHSPPRGKQVWVAACWKCNQERGKENASSNVVGKGNRKGTA